MLAIATKGKGLSLWKLPDGKQIKVLQGLTGEDQDCCVYRWMEQNWLRQVNDKKVFIWNIADGKLISQVEAPHTRQWYHIQ